MKKVCSLLLIVCLTVTLFGGCAKKQDPAGQNNSVATPSKATKEKEQHLLMWRVIDENGHEMYLMGTIHIGDKRSKKIVAAAEEYLSECDALAVEFDTVAYQKDTAAMTDDLTQFVYTDGKKIGDHLPKEVYESAVAFMKENYTYSPMFDYYNIALWDQFVEEAAIENSDLKTKYAIDELLIRAAYDEKMPVYDIESAAEQMEMLNRLSEEYHICSIKSVIEVGVEEYNSSLKEMYEIYVSGDAGKLEELLDSETEDTTPREKELIEEANRVMIDERNEKMAQTALSYLESGDTVFFAVGSAHMLGKKGIVSLLTENGCTVQRVGQMEK